MSLEQYIARKHLRRPYGLRLAEQVPTEWLLSPRQKAGRIAFIIGFLLWVHVPAATLLFFRTTGVDYLFLVVASPLAGMLSIGTGLILAPSRKAKIAALLLTCLILILAAFAVFLFLGDGQ